MAQENKMKTQKKKEKQTRKERTHAVNTDAELFDKIQDGNLKNRNQALTTLIENNLGLVIKIARDYRHCGLPWEDLVSEGSIGLIKAAERFDLEKGVKFSSYAAYWIKQAILRASENKAKLIRIPVQSARKMRKIRTAAAKIKKEQGREAENTEIAEEIGCSPKTVRKLRFADVTACSMSEPVYADSDLEVKDSTPDEKVLSPEKELMRKEFYDYLAEVMETLDDREIEILRLYFGLNTGKPKTRQFIGDKFGISRERVRQIQKRSLEKLKAKMEDVELEWCG